MKLGNFTKQPRERESFTISYEDDLTDNDIVISAEVAISSPDLVVDQIAVFPDRVRFWVVGGIDATSYKLTFTVETNDGRLLEDEVTIKVKEL